ncbi:hypothetical protein AB4876_01635 [Zhongshania guokunii]|uniref:Porin n=1 Tax=Zhongshania guokunii TaxID=641783 RepID=A0ABV3U1B1_9GAMM
MPHTIKTSSLSALLSLCTLSIASLSQALPNNDLQVHGFISQAYILSDGNNFYGDSQRGSTDYMEAAINSTWRVTPNLNFAGQILSRDAGNTDNGDLKIDFLFADIKAVENDMSGLGFRLGRVRNAFGFYNDTRDVIFTRPSILMPQAVYFEGNGLRELLFSADGAQLYSYWDADENSTTFTFTLGRTKSLSADIIKNIFGQSSAIIHKGELKNPIFAQLQHSRNGGDSKFGISMLNVSLALNSINPANGDVSLDANGYVLSAQKNLAMWTFTSEYSLISVEYQIGQAFSQEIEAAYIQAQYRLNHEITLTGRYEMSVLDRDNRNETDSHNLVFGVRWTPAANWIIDADVYGIRGTSGIPGIDNAGNMPLAERTEIFAVMVGYRF